MRVLLIAGSTDEATPPEGLRFVQERVAGSKMLTLDAAHLSNVEQAEAFTSAVMGFLGSIGLAASSKAKGKFTLDLRTLNFQIRSSLPVTVTLIVSQSTVIVACLSSPACTTSLCIPADSCMSIDVLPVAEMRPRVGLWNDRSRRQAVGVNAEMVVRRYSGALVLL